MKKCLMVLLATLIVMTTLCGCAGSTGDSSGNTSSAATTTTGKPTYGGSIVVGIQQDIDSLDPHKATAAGTKEILFNIFEGLVKPDENGNLIDAVAQSHTLSDDGLKYTFVLRDNVKFHNGNAVTAEDVKYSIERAAGLLDGTPLISTLKVVTSVDIIDEKTVQVTVDKVNPELIYSFTAAVIPAGSGEDASASPIGTGPFSFVSYTPQEGIILKKNPDYWQSGLPYLDEVNFKIVAGSDTALLELKGGSIDIYSYLTDTQAEELKDSFQILSAPSDVVQALFLNCAKEPLNDERVRQAISYAIDKNEINGFLSGGAAIPVGSAMLPTLKNYYEDTNSVYGISADVEKAKQLLADAGYPNGIDLEIMIPSNYEFHMQTGEVVVEQLKAVGINATINAVEWSTWLSDCYTDRNYTATICGITGDMTPGYLLNRFVSTSSKNFINYSNAEYDSVYAKIEECKTLDERAEYYKQLQQIMTQDAGTAFLMVPPITIAVNPKLSGYTFYPVYVQDISTIYFTE